MANFSNNQTFFPRSGETVRNRELESHTSPAHPHYITSYSTLPERGIYAGPLSQMHTMNGPQVMDPQMGMLTTGSMLPETFTSTAPASRPVMMHGGCTEADNDAQTVAAWANRNDCRGSEGFVSPPHYAHSHQIDPELFTYGSSAPLFHSGMSNMNTPSTTGAGTSHHERMAMSYPHHNHGGGADSSALEPYQWSQIRARQSSVSSGQSAPAYSSFDTPITSSASQTPESNSSTWHSPPVHGHGLHQSPNGGHSLYLAHPSQNAGTLVRDHSLMHHQMHVGGQGSPRRRSEVQRETSDARRRASPYARIPSPPTGRITELSDSNAGFNVNDTEGSSGTGGVVAAVMSSHGGPASPPSSEVLPNSDSPMVPVRQDPLFPEDVYTPRFKRRNAQGRWEGWCGFCTPGRWLDLKNSRYWEDKLRNHGICARTKVRFQGPEQVRWMGDDGQVLVTFQPGMVTNRTMDGQKREGLCHVCRRWIAMDGSRTRARDRAVNWWLHAYKCHDHTRFNGSGDASSSD